MENSINKYFILQHSKNNKIFRASFQTTTTHPQNLSCYCEEKLWKKKPNPKTKQKQTKPTPTSQPTKK